MARFEVNGSIYESNETGNYFYKSTGLNDKNGNPIMKRVSRAVYKQAFDEYAQNAKDEAERAEAEADRQTEENFNKKHGGVEIPKSALDANKRYIEKQAKKAAKIKKAAYVLEQNGEVTVTLTDKQVDFMHEMTKSNFWEEGLESSLWCDVLVEEIGGQFANSPFVVGAMISTLREKSLITVGVQKTNGRKCKFFELTELGKQVAQELGLH